MNGAGVNVRGAGTFGGVPPTRLPNFVVIVIDDVGLDLIGTYGEAPVQAACTPRIDDMAANGLLFRNAYANPICSPTRAQILTGRHGFRTGIGTGVRQNGNSAGLPISELTIPRALSRYDSSAIGKWHLANPVDQGDGQGPMHPLNVGFRYHAGSLFNLNVPGPVPPMCFSPFSYFHWVKAVNGVLTCRDKYATTDTADDAIQRAQAMRKPWVLYVAFNAAHTPVHAPPPELCPDPSDPACTCQTASTNSERVKAMTEALDTELGRMLDGIRAVDPDVHVFLTGDNGTAPIGSEGMPGGCFDPARAKATVYEAGINVPLIVQGPGIAPREVAHLASSTDIFATVMELAGVPSSAEDSVSLVPYMNGSDVPLRETAYAERFGPNGGFAMPNEHLRAIRNDRFKLLRLTSGTFQAEELYDLSSDPCETQNLFPPTPGSLADEHYVFLDQKLQDMGVA